MRNQVPSSGSSSPFQSLVNALCNLGLPLFLLGVVFFMATSPGDGENPKFFVPLIRRVSSITPIALLLARILPPLDRWWFRLSNGRQTLTSLLADVPVVMLTTVGARSGKPRTTPLLPIIDPAKPTCLALIATNFGQERYPQWYFNLKKSPQAVCAMHGEQKTYLAREAEGEEYQRYWQLAEETFFGYRLYRQRIRSRRIPILILEPLEKA
jgi:deazaflavin-dependent oxidoreductase (nitroreductase family)